MTKKFKFYNESQVQLGISADESEDEPKKTGLIEAQFTTWGAREGADGRRFFYKPEPFQEWIDNLVEQDKPLPMFFQHNENAIPVGEWTEFMIDDVGMSGKGRLFTNTSAGNDLYTIMKESPNLIGGVSVGAYADEFCMVSEEGDMLDGDSYENDDGYFQITKGGLNEVSIVMSPNNLEANINRLEFYQKNGSLDLRVLEDALRDAGVSSRNAVVAASVFKKVQEQRDVAVKLLNKAPKQRDSDAEATETLLASLQERDIVKQLNKRLKG